MEKNKEALWSAGTLFVEVGRVAGVVIGEPLSGGDRLGHLPLLYQ